MYHVYVFEKMNLSAVLPCWWGAASITYVKNISEGCVDHRTVGFVGISGQIISTVKNCLKGERQRTSTIRGAVKRGSLVHPTLVNLPPLNDQTITILRRLLAVSN